MTRHRWPLRNRYLAVLASVAALVLTACGGPSPGSTGPGPPSASIGTAIDNPVPKSVGRIPLVDAHGTNTSLASFQHKIVVVSDSMTLCQETCPLDTANIVAAARDADAAGLTDQIEFLTITVDPHRDTPARLRAYRKFFAKAHALPNWRLLTGTPHDVDKLWKYFGVYWKKGPQDSPPGVDWMTHKPLTYDIEHSDQVLFLDGDDHERFVISGPADLTSKGALPGALHRFLNDEGRENLEHPDKLAWTVPQVLDVLGWLTDHHIAAKSARSQ